MTVHIVGAGLAGLSAALSLADAGQRVVLHEAGPAAGGRCRSYPDRELGCRVDNGNHLLLSGNAAAFGFLERIGARDTLGGPGEPFFPFLDRADGARWTVRPNAGRLPWWVLSRARNVPGARLSDYLALLRVLRATPGTVVSAALGESVLVRRLLAPLAIAALNTPPAEGLASLLAAVVRETLMAGGAACIPCFPREGLSESFVQPALAALAARGGELRTGARIAALAIEGGRVTGLRGPAGAVELDAGDAAVLAVPPWVAEALLPGLTVPDAFQAIVNVHFRADAPPPAGDAARAGFVGVIGGTAEWVFAKQGHYSVTISAANALAELPAGELAARTWPDVRAAFGLPAGDMPAGQMPAWRVVKEKRATFAATAASEARRPGADTRLANLWLAGDWTATGLPATIEGAIRSGRTAAARLLAAEPWTRR